MFFSHGLGRVTSAFGVESRGIVYEVWHLWSIPSAGSVVMLVKFDFQVNLHFHYNCTFISSRDIIFQLFHFFVVIPSKRMTISDDFAIQTVQRLLVCRSYP